MPNTKDFIPVDSIKENSVVLKDGSVAMVIQTSAVNFDLLSEQEQLAIIGSFAALLNSLSFSIQILIRSKKLDISHYLNTLKDAERKQHNPLLQLMMQHYRAFVAAIIRDNEVLDKQFYVIIAVSPVELGVVSSSDKEKNLQKALTILNPRRDNIIKQLSRIGLKSDQLDNERLIRLFYDTYNDAEKISLADMQGNPANQTPENAPTKFEYGTSQKPPAAQTPPEPQFVQAPAAAVSYAQAARPIQPPSQPAANPSTPIQPPQPLPQAGVFNPQVPPPPQPQQAQKPPPLYSSPQSGNNSPFIVEELPN